MTDKSLKSHADEDNITRARGTVTEKKGLPIVDEVEDEDEQVMLTST